MNVENVCKFMNEAVLFKSKLLQEKCCELFEMETKRVLMSSTFAMLSQSALSAFLEVDKVNVLEIVLFRAVLRWMKARCEEYGIPLNGKNMRKVIGDGFFKIRYPAMTVQDFGNSVSVIDGFLTESEIKQTFQKIVVFDNKNIECPFKSDYRCSHNSLHSPLNDMKALLRKDVLYEVKGEHPSTARSLAVSIKDSKSGECGYPPSFRLLLQCCADMANSCYFPCSASPENYPSREKLVETFEKWGVAALNYPRDASEHMTKFLELRSDLGNLTNWL